MLFDAWALATGPASDAGAVELTMSFTARRSPPAASSVATSLSTNTVVVCPTANVTGLTRSPEVELKLWYTAVGSTKSPAVAGARAVGLYMPDAWTAESAETNADISGAPPCAESARVPPPATRVVAYAY